MMSVLLFFVFMQEVSVSASEEINEKIEKLKVEITQTMEEHNIPGMAVAIVDKHGFIYTEGFGYSNSEKRVAKIDEETNFHLGSLSKVFTSIAVLQLYEKEKLNLDTAVVHYLPWFPFNEITVKHLLQHSSGLPGRLNVHDISNVNPEEITEMMEAKLKDVSLVGKPGEVYEYTNMNTDLLQRIVEEVTNESFPNYMETNVFHPLHMHRTGYYTFNSDHLRNTADGHRYHWGKLKPYDEQLVYATSSSAGLSSNATDLANFLFFLLQEEKGHMLVTQDSIDEMFRPNQYGLGMNWFIFPHNITMDGGLPGFTTSMVLSADRSFGLVLLANSKQDVTLDTSFNLYKILEGTDPTPLLSSNYPKVSSEAKTVLFAIMILFVSLAYVVGMTSYRMVKGERRLFFKVPSRKESVHFMVVLLLYLSIIYYIYVILPFYIGVPSLFEFKKEPDFTSGLAIFSVLYTVFSVVLFWHILFVNKVENNHKANKII
ncbi:serine hydrolase domain-containing protein [Alkalihalobacterium bogoriense]|uniref:serine hydrolase domain-containing protein n=1 Tax=Alkalihalobacterium bogoriense TaxID=246272 RepID=UPI00047EB194|nr:serine hydrolase domain-containing protein [Alkalihalobacterium bogoriense]